MNYPIIFFEDDKSKNFSPIALFRPVFELLCGHFSLRERVQLICGEPDWGVQIRVELEDVYREQHPSCHVNSLSDFENKTILFLNGRWLPGALSSKNFENGQSGWIGGELVWVVLEPNEARELADGFCTQKLVKLAANKKRETATGSVLEHPWDLIHQNANQIAIDHELRPERNGQSLEGNPGVVGEASQIFVDPSAEVDPFVVLDARNGPIWVEKGVKLQAFTRIEGPCFIGAETQTFRANIRSGSSLGPVCRIGGEVEESIVQGFVNKYHDGFLGHSYVASWVNLGALTSNSDLKNDYSEVSVPLEGIGVRTGSNKVGCFIGDHAKTALCSLFNTGSSIGAMAFILPGGELLPKHVPSFSRIWHGQLEPIPNGVASGIEIARTVMARRGVQLTRAMENLIQTVFEQTSDERKRAMDRLSNR